MFRTPGTPYVGRSAFCTSGRSPPAGPTSDGGSAAGYCGLSVCVSSGFRRPWLNSIAGKQAGGNPASLLLELRGAGPTSSRLWRDFPLRSKELRGTGRGVVRTRVDEGVHPTSLPLRGSSAGLFAHCGGRIKKPARTDVRAVWVHVIARSPPQLPKMLAGDEAIPSVT